MDKLNLRVNLSNLWNSNWTIQSKLHDLKFATSILSYTKLRYIKYILLNRRNKLIYEKSISFNTYMNDSTFIHDTYIGKITTINGCITHRDTHEVLHEGSHKNTPATLQFSFPPRNLCWRRFSLSYQYRNFSNINSIIYFQIWKDTQTKILSHIISQTRLAPWFREKIK